LPDFNVRSTSPCKRQAAASPLTGPAERRQDLIVEAHIGARSTHLHRQHIANMAKRLGIDPKRIEFAGGGVRLERVM